MRLGCLLLVLAAACGGNDVECIEVDVDCAPLYEPTFDNVFAQTLQPECGIDGPCHNAQAARAGIVYANADDSFDHLVTDGRVEPGNPECSLLTLRIESTSGGFVMPPGNRLSAEERCSIIQWINNGAQR